MTSPFAACLCQDYACKCGYKETRWLGMQMRTESKAGTVERQAQIQDLAHQRRPTQHELPTANRTKAPHTHYSSKPTTQRNAQGAGRAPTTNNASGLPSHTQVNKKCIKCCAVQLGMGLLHPGDAFPGMVWTGRHGINPSSTYSRRHGYFRSRGGNDLSFQRGL